MYLIEYLLFIFYWILNSRVKKLLLEEHCRQSSNGTRNIVSHDGNELWESGYLMLFLILDLVGSKYRSTFAFSVHAHLIIMFLLLVRFNLYCLERKICLKDLCDALVSCVRHLYRMGQSFQSAFLVITVPTSLRLSSNTNCLPG